MRLQQPRELLWLRTGTDSCSRPEELTAGEKTEHNGGSGACSMENMDGKPAGSTAVGQKDVLNQYIHINGFKPLQCKWTYPIRFGPEETKQVLETIRQLERTKVPKQLNGQQLIRIKSFKRLSRLKSGKRMGPLTPLRLCYAELVEAAG